jgi:TolB-like protein
MQFGPYVLKRQERVVEGPSGPVELSARAFDILCLLLDKPGEVVSKEAIFAAVWPGVVVEENTLQVHISALRKALPPNMIATVHGRGYKYAGPAPEPVASSAPSAPGKGSLERKPIIVVLPFENASGDPEQQFFSDGITEDITDRLTRFRILSVIGQHSAFAFRGATPDIAAIRERLKADFVVTGSVRRAGERIRISVRLSDAMSEASVWAERYDRPLAGIVEVQDELTGLIAAAVANQLEIEIGARSGGGNPTSFASYELILEGNWHFKKLTIAANDLAIACYNKALAIEPRSAEAMSALATGLTSGWLLEFSAEKLARGVEIGRRAVEFDPLLAKAHAATGFGLLFLDGLAAAREPIERALALNPDDWFCLTNRSMVCVYEGKPEEARHWLERSRRLNPLPPIWLTEFECITRFGEERFAEVLAGVEVIPDGTWDMMYALACYGHLGLADKAKATLARFASQGRRPDFGLGAEREPYTDPAIRKLLIDGLKKASAL